MRDEQTLNLQRNRALAIIDGNKLARRARCVKVTDEEKAFDEKAYEWAMKLTGFKGYVTNIPAATMPATEVVGSYCWEMASGSARVSKR
ncbi:hypothetical protein [Brevibacterium sp. S111]|uniref:hypothetical protein n=1 Tax=Brevibacterium sp. S111 TaxID=2483795 RepID=UPI00196B23F1|nr:hypothetical protein [Brevibacterium sp. S111]